MLNDLISLVPRPVRAIRVTRGGLEPSANFPDKLDRWRHIRNRLGRLGTRLWFNIPFKGIQDSLGFRIPGRESESFVSRTWLPDSKRWWDSGFLELHLDSKAQYSRFHEQKFPEFRVKISLIHGAIITFNKFKSALKHSQVLFTSGPSCSKAAG